MEFIKKLVILKGNSFRGTVSFERNAFGDFAHLRAHGLRDLTSGEYVLAIKSNGNVIKRELGSLGSINVRFEIFGIDLSNAHCVLFDNVTCEPLMYGTNAKTELWLGNVMDGIIAVKTKDSAIKTIENKAKLDYSLREGKRIEDYFLDVLPYCDNAVAEVNYYLNETSANITDSDTLVKKATDGTVADSSDAPAHDSSGIVGNKGKTAPAPDDSPTLVKKATDGAVADNSDAPAHDSSGIVGNKGKTAPAPDDSDTLTKTAPDDSDTLVKKVTDGAVADNSDAPAHDSSGIVGNTGKTVESNVIDSNDVTLSNAPIFASESAQAFSRKKPTPAQRYKSYVYRNATYGGVFEFSDKLNGDGQVYSETATTVLGDVKVKKASEYSLSDAVKNGTHKATFYELIKPQLDEMFKKGERFPLLEQLLPESTWTKIRYDENRCYYVGVIATDYVAYAVDGTFAPTPPKELGVDASFVPKSSNDLNGEGFWIMFQSGVDGQSVKVEY